MDALLQKYEQKITLENENWDKLKAQLEQQFMMEQGAHLGRVQQLQMLADERKKELADENIPLDAELKEREEPSEHQT